MSEEHLRQDTEGGWYDVHEIPGVDATSDAWRRFKNRGSREQTSDEMWSLLGVMKLARALHTRFQMQGDPEDLNNAIHCNRLALLLTPDIHGLKQELLLMLGIAYLDRFKRNGRPVDVDKAIKCHVDALLYTSEIRISGRKADLLQTLGESCMARFKLTGETADINKAIGCYDQAALLIPHGHPHRSGIIHNRGNAYLARFNNFGELADIERAIECHAQAVQLTPDGHAGRPGCLCNLGSSHVARFEHNGDVSDINKAIDYQSQAVQLAPDTNADKPTWLGNLGSSYVSRFEGLGDPTDLDQGIDHADKPARLSSLGNAHLARHEHRGEFADVENAIRCYRRALLLTPDGHAEMPTRLKGLGTSYIIQFQRNGESSGLNNAISCYDRALLLTPDDHTDRPALLQRLGGAYSTRFDQLGHVADIDKAIYYENQALMLTPDGHEDKPWRLENLGSSYAYRFEWLGEIVDADQSIHYRRQAVLHTPDGHVDKPGWLNNLGVTYRGRYERLGEAPDLDKAIECGSEAVRSTQEGHASMPSLLNNLGISYINRFKLTRVLSDVDHAISCLGRAVLLTPDGHADKPARLSNLGSSYLARFDHQGEISDIDQAIDRQSHAVRLTPEGHSDMPLWLSNLGSSYFSRFLRNDTIADIDKAIEYQSRAALLIPDARGENLELQERLGMSYQSRFQRLGRASDLETASKAFAHGAQLSIGDPRTRFRASRSWAESSRLLGMSPQPAYQVVMELIPEVVWLGNTIGQRYRHVSRIGHIILEAVSSAISLQAFDRALEWLEQGRSIVWNQILQLRTPFDDISRADPALAKRLKEVGHKLERAGSRSEASSWSLSKGLDLERDAESHRRLAAEWNQLLEQARCLPEFHNFMRPRKAMEIMHAAKDGPVVVINVHSSRCDALIILPDSEHLAHVPLENFSPEKAAEARAQLRSSIGHRGARDGGFKRIKPVPNHEDTFAAMLATLWTDVVKPILDFLGYTRKRPVDELPHITWCTTGALSFLPLHAAGCYDGSQPNAFDLVVSSYTPTLSALIAPGPSHTQGYSGIVAVGQESTTGLSYLPNTVVELATIRKHVKQIQYLQLDGENATVEDVLNAMDAYSWVHLACHASQNMIDPAQSAFHLHDGDLLLSEITKRTFQNKGLAFLSACQTATGDEKLADEAVHLAAGMLMAGYPSVIATMWGINDEDAPEVAQQVYAELLRDGKLDHTLASRALHKAVMGLREKIGEKKFKRWVPFVHIGS